MIRPNSPALRALRDGMHATSFTPSAQGGRVGAEVELLAHDERTKRPLALSGARGLVALLRQAATAHGWLEFQGYDGTPRFDVPGRAQISFEPGGQIELSSAVFDTPTVLVQRLGEVIDTLDRTLGREGVALRSVGIDPYNDAVDIPLQLDVDRYQRMTRYFESIGPFGIRMMRQTAAIQISLDRGERPGDRWRLLNDLAPYLIAIFANSPRHAGVDTGHRSFRAHCWRQLDSSRTGVAEPSNDPAASYTSFALSAIDMLRTDATGRHLPFAQSGEEGKWQRHLTTLFPEVRPRGHFEVRSCDMIPTRWLAVPIVFVAALAYDPHAAAEAALLAAESRALLRLAGERGLGDTAIARTSRDLFQLALDGAARLGPTYIAPSLLETARAFQAEYTARDRSPADDFTADTSRTAPAISRSPN